MRSAIGLEGEAMKCLIFALFALTAPVLLLGCVVMSGTSSTDFTATKQVDLVYIGLPAPLSWFVGGIQGSAFPVTDTLSLTAAHVAVPLLKSIRAQHPLCDVAVIARNNAGKPLHKLAFARRGRNVILFGYSAINSLPKSSSGMIDGFLKRDGCYYGVITGAGAVSGMSGGPVIDSLTGETVGVITNVILGKGAVVFIAVQDFTNLLDRMRIPYKTY
ncbi:hypothetical protein D3C75_286720 [compost metagenome]